MPEPILALGIGAYLFIVAVNVFKELSVRNPLDRHSRR
jgi:hypothetical protein